MKIDGCIISKTKTNYDFVPIRDSFQPIILSKTNAKPWFDDAGIKHIGLYDSLLDENALNM